MNKRILPILLAASFGAAIAAPTAPVVVSGQATFAQQGNVFSITNTPNAIINWQSFNIAPGEITRFIQQNADSAVLNRITGQDPSQILGALQSNGHVFLINPNGIMFGKDARIDVNGLTASTLNISNADFIAGKRNFASGGAAGAVANQGTIITPNGGSVFLIAPQVENSGIITAPNGQVVLAAGHTVQLVDSGNPDLHVVVSAPADQAINLGQVIAQGGRIGIYGALVNQRGIVNANSAVVGANGKIVLKASRDTLLEQGSVTTATGAGPGGDIRLLGARVGLTGNAQVDASGATGGGSVLVGGDYQGKNADQVAHAQNTWLGQGASIKADAIQTGNGGKVVLWSDGATSAFGSISARGGANGGNGGVVETSGHDLTVAGARVDTSAAKGKRGSWLLDPQNIIVDTTGSTPLADAAAFSSLPGADALVSKATLEAATSDVILQATNDITFNTAVNLGHALNATAGHAINVNADLTAGNIALTGDSINLAAGKKINSSNGCGSSCSVEFKANTLVFGPSSGSDITAVTASGSNSVISIVPLTGSRTMQFIDAAHRDSGKLSLTPTELGSLHAAEVNLGSSASTGDFLWSWAGGYPSGAFNTIVIETGGNIIFDNRLEMQDAGTIVLGSYGSGSITFNPSGELSAGKVFFRTDNLTLNSIAGITASDSINIDTYHLYRDIKLGSGAVDGAALAIDQTELDQLKSAKLEFGSATRTAPIEVVGNALYSQSTAQQMTLNLGTGGLTVYGAFDGGSNGTLLLNSNGGGITATSSGNLKANRVHIAGNGGTIVDLDNGAANYISALTGSDLGQLNIKLGGGSHIGSGTSGVTVTGTGGVYVKSLAGLIIDSVLDGGSGGVNLVGDNEGTLTVNSGGIVVGDNVTLDFFHGMNLAGHIAAVGDSGRLDIDSTGTLALGGSASATGLHANLYMHSTGATTLNGTVTADGEANVRSDAAIQVNGLLHANGDIYVEGQAITTGSTGLIYGPDLTVISKDSIGSSSAPLMTRVGGLWAQVENNNASIYVRNNLLAPGPLNLRLAYRFGAAFDSPGMVSIVNDGAMTLANRSTESSMQETVRSGQGDIHLETHSPLTIGGIVRSTTGNIDLIAGDGGELKVTNPGFVSSTSGNVSLTGGTIIAPAGSVVTTGTVTQNQTTAPPPPPPPPPPEPTVAECLATPSAAGCGDIIAKAKQACIADPSGPNCGALLPPLSLCKEQPSTEGCSAVLPKLAECIATPSRDGCSVVLPSAAVCAAHPTTEGCSVVNQCLADPKAPGCGPLLPTIGACIADKSLPGCDAVLPKVAECRANTTQPGCEVILPSLAICKLAPNTPNCDVVLPNIDLCIADKTRDGCLAVLPSIGQCTTDRTQKGCEVVLPPLSACVVNPNAEGCIAVLPTIDQCVATPSLPGCGVRLPSMQVCIDQPSTPGCLGVLPRIEACVTDPTRAGCVAVLPKLDACIADKTRLGCTVVLPTLAECIGSPSLNGCAVILPKIEQCAVNPSLQGCEAVLPKPDFCSTHPADPTCRIFGGNTGTSGDQKVQPVNQVVALLQGQGVGVGSKPGSTGTATDPNDKPTGKPGSSPTGGNASPEKTEGAKNVPATKTYCN